MFTSKFSYAADANKNLSNKRSKQMSLKRNLMQKLMKTSVVIGAALVGLCAWSVPGASAYLDPSDPANIAKYVNSLPVIKDLGLRIDMTKEGNIGTVEMRETSQNLLGEDTAGATFPATAVWGYKFPQIGVTTYPGATIVAKKRKEVTVTWANKLPSTHLLPVDTSIHWANPDSGIATVTHLHGGHTESASDGLPEAWFTQDFAETGPQFVKERYSYFNDQEAATLWYHDHALGITRLNVYAGLAGFYLLRDNNELKLIKNGVLPGGDYEIEMVIQDRNFDSTAQLALPTASGPEECPLPLPGDPACGTPFPTNSIVAEFFGDVILVNGAAWPKLEVEPRKYRIRLLNGSDSRFYVLQWRDTATGGGSVTSGGDHAFYVIGSDTGLLPFPVVPFSGGNENTLLIGPGERYDLVVDFSSFSEGDEVFLRNFGPDDPFKGFMSSGAVIGGSANLNTTGQIMKFVVSGTAPDVDASVDEFTWLRPDIRPLRQTGPTRKVALFEGLDEFGRLQPLLGVAEETENVEGDTVNGSLTWSDAITESVRLNDAEVWEIYNTTEDAHPIHLHLVAFQVIDRQEISFTDENKPQLQHDGSTGVGKVLTSLSLEGSAMSPDEIEEGWKDTVVTLPGQVTRVIAKFDMEGRYVWHCHILSHEDHEMMRPYEVREP